MNFGRPNRPLLAVIQLQPEFYWIFKVLAVFFAITGFQLLNRGLQTAFLNMQHFQSIKFPDLNRFFDIETCCIQSWQK